MAEICNNATQRQVCQVVQNYKYIAGAISLGSLLSVGQNFEMILVPFIPQSSRLPFRAKTGEKSTYLVTLAKHWHARSHTCGNQANFLGKGHKEIWQCIIHTYRTIYWTKHMNTKHMNMYSVYIVAIFNICTQFLLVFFYLLIKTVVRTCKLTEAEKKSKLGDLR